MTAKCERAVLVEKKRKLASTHDDDDDCRRTYTISNKKESLLSLNIT